MHDRPPASSAGLTPAGSCGGFVGSPRPAPRARHPASRTAASASCSKLEQASILRLARRPRQAAAEGVDEAVGVGVAAALERPQRQGPAHSRKTGSLSVVSACSGVLDRARRTQAKSPLGASNAWSIGIGHRAIAERVERPAVAVRPVASFQTFGP